MNILYQSPDEWIVEIPPQKRTIDVDGRIFCLPFPYLIFDIYQDGSIFQANLYFTNAPWLAKFYAPVLPNIQEGGSRVCFGHQLMDHQILNQEEVMRIISLLWSRSFTTTHSGWSNKDLVARCFGDFGRCRAIQQSIGDSSSLIVKNAYQRWSKLSIQDVLKVRWPVEVLFSPNCEDTRKWYKEQINA